MSANLEGHSLRQACVFYFEAQSIKIKTKATHSGCFWNKPGCLLLHTNISFNYLYNLVGEICSNTK